MAEELDIKSIWNKGKALEDTSSLKINTLERKGTKTTLYWIKVILWIEFWLSIAMLPAFIPYLVKRGDSIWFIISYLITTAIYLIYYQFLIRKVNHFSYDGNVVKSLGKVYGYLRFYILHYKVVIWVSMLIGVVYEFSHDNSNEALQKLNTPNEWLVFSLINLGLIGIIGGILHGLMNLIYGRKIKRLRRTIKDLAEEE